MKLIWKTQTFGKSIIQVIDLTNNKLTIEAHTENLCEKAPYKLWTLQRIRKFVTVMQAQALASSFVNSQFNYSAIVWMFCSRKPKLRLKNIHKRTLRVVYNGPLIRDHYKSNIHQKHLQFLATEVLKSADKSNPHTSWTLQ